VTAARGGACAALISLLTACHEVDPAEHLIDKGRATRVVAVCFGGTSPDLEAARRRFDAAGPMLNARAYARSDLEAELARRGGVLMDFTGRHFHSAYMRLHLWPHVEESVTGYAILEVDPQVVFVESVQSVPKGAYRKSPTVFYPWDTHEDQARACR
jgi:hypothetical protein